MTVPLRPLNSLCNVRIGRTPRRDSPEYWGGTGIWVTIGELNGGEILESNEHISDVAMREVMPPPVPAGTLLFSFKLSIGKMATAGVPLYTNEAIAALEIRNTDELDRNYLRYALMATSSAAQTNHAVLGKVLNKAKVEALPIPIRPIGEQRHVVDLLSRAETIVRVRGEAEAKAKEIIPALFVEMFGDPGFNGRLERDEGRREAVNVSAFGSLGRLDRGRSRHRPRDAAHLYGGRYPLIQTGEVARSDGAITAYSQTYSDAGLAQSELWPAGTLCITIAANIAETGVLKFDACFPDSVVGFLPGPRVRTEYIQQWLGFLQPTLAAQAPQAAQKNINLAILKNLQVPVPSLAEQDAFAAQARTVRAMMGSQKSASAYAGRAFQSLLAGVFHQ